MKKHFTHLMTVVAILVGHQLYSQVIVQGPRTVCSGQTATYTVYGPSCIVQNDGPSGLNHGTYSPGPGIYSFTVTWSNTGTTNIVDNFSVYVSAMYWDPYTGNQTGCPPVFVIPVSVTILPNTSSVTTPSTPSVTYISGRLYEFTTSSSNATNYQWQVTGGTIQGSTNGQTIRVIRNNSSCTITAKARGYATSCGGNVYSSYSSTRSYTVPAPTLSYITGSSSYLSPYSSGTYSPYFSSTSSENGGASWSLSDPGGRLTLDGLYGTTTVRMGAPTSTLYFATLTCTASHSCGSKSVSMTIMYGGSSMYRTSEENIDGLSEDMAQVSGMQLYPNPVLAGGKAYLEVFDQVEIDEYLIMDTSGKVVYKSKIDQLSPRTEIPTQEFSKGIYVIKVFNKSDIVQTSKLIIK